ncbi:MAG: hypothetical protein JWO83_2568 [Caulobacteraceae bacterium]|nr:hypothetical protein [Caulobacteraceae bacterium]
MKAIAVTLLCLGLAACETPTLYQAAARPEAVGYSELRIEPGRYRVTFQGGDGAPAPQIEDYAMRRAAEITLRDGYDWFEIVDRSGQMAPPHSSSAISIGGGGADFGRGGGVGLGLGAAFPLSGGPRITRSLEIFCGRGPRPPQPNAYDARGVLASLSAPPGTSAPPPS